MDDPVFKALSDPNRRMLLDRLFERDGQTLGELDAALPEMTRFGVMKHLRVLEAASLVTTRRAGRRKLHFLNPVPIRLIHDRWISKYAEPWVSGMAELKHDLEAPTVNAPMHVYEIYIRATPERIWQALTDSELVKRYYFGSVIESDGCGRLKVDVHGVPSLAVGRELVAEAAKVGVHATLEEVP